MRSENPKQSDTNIFLRPSLTSVQIGQRVRTTRHLKGWTLNQMAAQCSIKAVVLGSYERGARNMPLSRLLEIAQTLDLELSTLLATSPLKAQSEQDLMIDLRALSQPTLNQKPWHSILLSFSAGIVKVRGDWNGEILSLRRTDLQGLSYATGTDLDSYRKWLQNEKYLIRGIDQLLSK
jgi:transcriptional regulator with XRE-family HTH domain